MKYMKNVYHIDRAIQKLSDGRKYPKYNTDQTIILLLFGDVHLMFTTVKYHASYHASYHARRESA
jgi:hypothetical protein